MKKDSQENETWWEDEGNIKAQVWWRRSVEVTCGGRYGGKNMYVLNDNIINKHYFNYEGRQLGEQNLEGRWGKH